MNSLYPETVGYEILAIVDGFKDVDYINTIYELVPEIKTQEKGKLK